MSSTARKSNIGWDLPSAFSGLLKKIRYKVYWGGRGSAKSWSIARTLIARAYTTRRLKIGCFRELQTSIADSVHALLKEQIIDMGLEPWFEITDKSIECRITGSVFIFKGLRHNVVEIKSLEGIDIAWVEEAQLVSKESWQILIPTIRKEGSEIWVSFNPIEETDDTYRRFVVSPPGPEDGVDSGAYEKWAEISKVSWEDNQFFPAVLDAERRYMLRTDPEAYEHVWGGFCRTISEAVIFKGRYVVEPFETPPDVRFHHGLDFGFSTDPTAFTRSFITDQDDPRKSELWIDRAEFGHQVELDTLPEFLERVDTSKQWPIKADGSRPETISYLKRQSFQISAAEKWAGSVEDGVAHLKGFRKIHIHSSLKDMAQEARLYSWKVDRVSKDVLPIIVDKHNHGWDSIRYGLDGYIHKRGKMGQWDRLVK